MSIFDRFFKNQIELPSASSWRSSKMQDTFLIGTRSMSQSDRDRFTYDREEIHSQSLEAWRVNPLARRIVELTTQYIVGGGLLAQLQGREGIQILRSVLESPPQPHEHPRL